MKKATSKKKPAPKKKVSRKKPNTPRGRVKSVLRRLFFKSRERSAAIRREKGCCERCGASPKLDKEVKIEVHHKKGVKWEQMLNMLYKELLCNPEELEVLCSKCHEIETEKQTKKREDRNDG